MRTGGRTKTKFLQPLVAFDSDSCRLGCPDKQTGRLERSRKQSRPKLTDSFKGVMANGREKEKSHPSLLDTSTLAP